MTYTAYTTWGPVRGSCGHRHRTITTAQACADRDDRDCKAGNGRSAYSDRHVTYADGRPVPTQVLYNLLGD